MNLKKTTITRFASIVKKWFMPNRKSLLQNMGTLVEVIGLWFKKDKKGLAMMLVSFLPKKWGIYKLFLAPVGLLGGVRFFLARMLLNLLIKGGKIAALFVIRKGFLLRRNRLKTAK